MDKRILVSVFEEVVDRWPERIAVEAPDGKLTFTELDRAANDIAGCLMAEGFGAGEIAAVFIPNSAAYVAAVRNLTSEHVNGEAIRQYIEVELDDSERFVLVDRSAAREQALKELEVQQGALVDPATAVRVGKHIGAQYLFFGTLTSIETQSGRKKGQYFLFTLKFLDVETGRFRTTRKEIQKLSKRGLFGW